MNESATLLERALADGGLSGEIIVPGVPTPTVPAAAAALGVGEERILKSLVFVSPDGDTVLAIACGQRRIDRVRLAAAAGLPKLRMAPPDLVLERTGYPIGGVPPVCHATPLAVFLDRAVLDLPEVFGGGGVDGAMLRITPSEIVRLTGAKVVDIAD